MASEEDVYLREVDEDLSRERTMTRFRQWRVPLAIAALAILGVVVGFQLLQSRTEQARIDAAESYAELSFMAEGDVPPSQLLAYADDEKGGYAVLAKLRAAADLGAAGDLEGARDLYADIYQNSGLSDPIRDFARIRAAYLLFDNRPQAAAEIASGIETSAFRAHADEIASGAALAGGEFLAAKTGFEALAVAENVPAAIQARARTYAAVADAASSGTPLTAPENPTSFIDRFGADLEAAGVPTGSEAEVPGLGEFLASPPAAEQIEADQPEVAPRNEDDGAGGGQ